MTHYRSLSSISSFSMSQQNTLTAKTCLGKIHSVNLSFQENLLHKNDRVVLRFSANKIKLTRGRYHGGRRPSSDDSLHSPTVIPPSALDKLSIMKRYHHRWTCSHTSPRRSPTMVTLHDTRFVECRWWNDGWTVKTVVTWRSSASMIPAPGVTSSELLLYELSRILHFSTRLTHTVESNHSFLLCKFSWQHSQNVLVFPITCNPRSREEQILSMFVHRTVAIMVEPLIFFALNNIDTNVHLE